MQANQTVLNDLFTKHPFAAAQVLDGISSEEIAAYFETLSTTISSTLLNFMDAKKASECVLYLSPAKSNELMEKGDVSVLASILKNLNTSQRKKIIASISAERVSIINRQLEVLPNTIASIMETAIVATKTTTVVDIIQLVRRDRGREDFYIYVVDLEGVFIGFVRPKELLLADDNDLIEDVMTIEVQTFLKDIPIKSVALHPVWKEYQEVPILDSSGKLLGKITYRSILTSTISHSKTSNSEIAETGSAIGELFRIGITGLLQGSGK